MAGSWVGFGLAEPTVGGMAGADTVLAYVDSDGNVVVRDSFATALATPVADCSQDWEATSGGVVGDNLVVELRRLLVTEDGEDRPVAYGIDNVGRPMRVILAHGQVSGDGVFGYHSSNRIAVKLNLLDPTASLDELATLRTDPDVVTIELRKWKISYLPPPLAPPRARTPAEELERELESGSIAARKSRDDMFDCC